ncbi:MAG: hypothetical protein WBH66_10705, partial [Rectinemataceae bacterium]
LSLVDEDGPTPLLFRKRAAEIDEKPRICGEARPFARIREIEDEGIMFEEPSDQRRFACLPCAKENMDKGLANFPRKQGRKCSSIVIHKVMVWFYSRNVKHRYGQDNGMGQDLREMDLGKEKKNGNAILYQKLLPVGPEGPRCV